MTTRPDDRTSPPDVVVERYRLGEMTPAEAAAFEQRLSRDAATRERLQALEDSDDLIRREYPPAVLAAQVRQRVAARAGLGRTWAGAWLPGPRWRAMAALAGVLVLLVVAVPPLMSPGDESAVRIKGLEPTLLLFRRTPAGSEPLLDGAAARAGDLIRVGYRAAGHAWGVIVSVDGRGVVTRHLPQDGERAARLAAAPEVLLDFAYELDDAPRWERFYFVAGSDPFDITPVLESVRRVASGGATPPPVLPLGKAVKQSSALLIK